MRAQYRLRYMNINFFQIRIDEIQNILFDSESRSIRFKCISFEQVLS